MAAEAVAAALRTPAEGEAEISSGIPSDPEEGHDRRARADDPEERHRDAPQWLQGSLGSQASAELTFYIALALGKFSIAGVGER